MKRSIVEVNVLQIGSIESEYQEIINLIENYTFPADFFHWISKGEYDHKVLHNQVTEDNYSRIVQFYIHDLLVFTGRAELFLDKMMQDSALSIVNAHPAHSIPFGNVAFERKHVSKVTADPHYNVISQIYEKGELCGTCWEIYELSRLVGVYKGKEDPLRHWRSR